MKTGLSERREELVCKMILPSAIAGIAMAGVALILDFSNLLYALGLTQFSIKAWFNSHIGAWIRPVTVAFAVVILSPFYIVMSLSTAIQRAKKNKFETVIFALTIAAFALILSIMMAMLWVV